ncbi:MAG: hypothetical protein HGA85_08255 [Nanoarchaeota archaeon]|nr:hypothetical protein [Nanoarchaeota archaeon]
MSFVEEIRKHNAILVVVSDIANKESALMALKESQNSFQRIGYVLINEFYNIIIEEFNKRKIDLGKFFFIDAKTAAEGIPPILDNCIFISSPSSLTELRVAFNTLIEERNREIVFFDRFSRLMDCADIFAVTKLLHNLLLTTASNSRKVVFFVVADDSDRLVKDMTMFVDKTISI